jgi:DNA-binding CsgD family transcriptional regulator
MYEVNFTFFDSRSDRNRSLLEIQDEYRIYREKQWQDIQALKLKELEDSKKILFLQRTILIGSILVLLLIVFIYVKVLNRRYRFEKEQIRIKQELEIQKANELIELKNRELATSVLKLIQKDEIIDDFRNLLQNNHWNAEPKTLQSFIKSWELNYNRNWEEFEKRFVDINQNFYEKLYEKFPNLSPSDSRLCALIKLQFSSKEIAQLLGITNESVHTIRSRLRKKLDLPRDTNLTEYIAQF